MQVTAVYTAVNNLALLVTLWATALSLGMVASPARIVASLRPAGRLARAVLLNAAGIPLLAWALVSWLPMDRAYATGVLLMAFAAAGPLGLKLSQVARGDLPYAVSLVMLLEVLNVLVVPAWAALALHAGLAGAAVDPQYTARTLALYVLVPLALGWLIGWRAPARSPGWAAAGNRLSTVTLVVVLVMAINQSLGSLARLLGSWVPACALLILAASLAVGYALGGPQAPGRRSTGIVTGARAASLALLVARSSYPDRPEVAGAIVTYVLLALVTCLGVAAVWGRRSARVPEVSGAAAD